MSQIGVSYTPSGGSPVYNFVFDNFGGNDLPRVYSNDAAFDKSANGTSIVTGPAYRQKYIWAISSIIPTTQAALFDEMFQAWDVDRAAGLAAAVGVIDETFGSQVNTSALFSTAPQYTRMGPQYTMVSFGLTEA